MATRMKKVKDETEAVLDNNDDVSTDKLGTSTNDGAVPNIAGTFAVYSLKNGGMHLVYRLTGTDNDVHQEIPAFAVKMAMQASEGKGPMGHLGKMLGK